jgi:hypothetical protein
LRNTQTIGSIAVDFALVKHTAGLFAGIIWQRDFLFCASGPAVPMRCHTLRNMQFDLQIMLA